MGSMNISMRSWMGRFTTGTCVVGERSLIVGGNWNNGDIAGVGCANANNSLSNSNNNIGARLNYVRVPLRTKIIAVISTLPANAGKRQEKINVRLVPYEGNAGPSVVGWWA